MIKATAIYTGGGIYLYYAELKDGNWLMGNDDWLIIIDTNPLENEDVFEDSMYEEWQMNHLVKEIPEEEHNDMVIKVLDTIRSGNTIPEYDNFDISEIEYIYEK